MSAWPACWAVSPTIWISTPAGRPAARLARTRRLGQRMRRVEIGQAHHHSSSAEPTGVGMSNSWPAFHLRHAGSRRRGPRGAGRHAFGAAEDESIQPFSGPRYVLDRSGQGQHAGGGRLAGLGVGQVARGVAQEEALLREGRQQIGAFAGESWSQRRWSSWRCSSLSFECWPNDSQASGHFRPECNRMRQTRPAWPGLPGRGVTSLSICAVTTVPAFPSYAGGDGRGRRGRRRVRRGPHHHGPRRTGCRAAG